MMNAFLRAFVMGALVFAISTPLAAKTAEEISKERSVVMKKMDSAMNEISQRVGGLFAFDKKVIRQKAETIRDIAIDLKTFFPKGSTTSETLPEIWTDAEGFEKKIRKNVAKAEKLLGELDAADKDQVKKLYKGIHFACTGCHSGYRK
jgi:cytochrome c556